MDLEKYKKAWDNQNKEINKISKEDIYLITKKNSSSIVKWIFIIGVLEFLFWLIISLLLNTDYYKKILTELKLTLFVDIYSFLHYFIIIILLFFFFKNYKSISVSNDNTKTLLKKIINVRKTVKFYVYYNIIEYAISSIIMYVLIFRDIEKFKHVFHYKNPSLSNTSIVLISIILQIIIICVISLSLWLFYKLVYGKLLKKLNSNYKELIKLNGSTEN